MKNIALPSDIKSLIVNVSEEIKKKNLLEFTYTSLDINNIDYSSNDIIYSNYLEHSSQYQFFVFPNNFEYMIIELLDEVQKESQEKKDLNNFNLYVSKSFFVIYKSSKLYAYQVLNEKYTKDELFDFISKSFNITITNVFNLSDSDLNKFQKNIANKKHKFININKKSNKSFLLYVVYLLICISSVGLYKTYENKNLENEKLEKIKTANTEYLKISKMLKFNPFKEEYKRLINTTNKFNLKILSLNYSPEIMKIQLSTKNKENIYSFLDEYSSNLLGNSISKLDSKKIYIGMIDVKPN